MHFAVNIPNFGAFADPRDLAGLAALAEGAGWDGVFVWDHVVRREGDVDLADPWVALAAVALATTRVAIGPMVTPLPRRRPWNVARAVVTLDHLSGGRMVLGVGLGTLAGPEFSAFGEETDPRVRGDQLDEGLAIVRAAWTGQPVEAHGTHYRVDGQRFWPRPVHGTVPLWAATTSVSGRAVRRAAGLDGVFPVGLTPGQVTELVGNVTAARPPSLPAPEVIVLCSDDDPAPWAAAGATWWQRQLPWDQPLEVSRRLVAAGPPR